MTDREALEILDKKDACVKNPARDCLSKPCELCENHTDSLDVFRAQTVAHQALREKVEAAGK